MIGPTYKLAPGGYKARANDFDIPEHHMLGYIKNRHPVLFHSHPGQHANKQHVHDMHGVCSFVIVTLHHLSC